MTLVGRRLGRYEIRAPLGSGGMGEVYLAQDAQLRRPVALKVLPQQYTNDEDRLRRFEQEAHAASALNHPYIITIHEIGSEGDTHFIATEFIDGESLRQRMKREGLKMNEALEVSIQVASALVAAHETGIVHRDIKPENIMLRRDGYVKVLDFGLAKLTEKSPAHQSSDSTTATLLQTDPGTVMGTAQYMSPEQARGLSVDERTDVWSLGCVLYEMVAGRAPFWGETSSHIIVSILESNPARLTKLRPGLPAELERIVEKALTKDKDARYQTAKDLMIDLRVFKQRLEFDAEMERSAPDSIPQTLAAQSHERATAETITGPATDISVKNSPASSIGHFIGGFKSHKIATLIAALILLATTLTVIYLYNSSHTAPTVKGEAMTPVAEPPIDSIAVLPLVNVGASPDTEYLSDGITDGIINSLTKLPHLRVIARSSVFQYKGKETNPQDVARELNVRAVVTGRLVQRGDGLSIAVELMDASSNRQLWGERYDRNLSDLLSVQREISKEISEKLRVRLTPSEEKQLAKRYTENDEAYRLVLLGNYYMDKLTEEGIAKGISYYNQAIEKDQNFALAYARLGDAYINSWLLPPREAMPKARKAALQALQLDDSLADAHATLAWIKAFYDYDLQSADRDFKRAIELNPGSSLARNNYGIYLAVMKRPDEALSELKRAEEIDPLSLSTKTVLGLPYLYARQYDQAIEQFKRALSMDPNFGYAHDMLGVVYGFKGMYRESLEEFSKAKQISDEPVTLAHTGWAYGLWGNKVEARKALDQLMKRSKKEFVLPFSIAMVYLGLGEKDQALDWLEKAYEYRDLILPGLKYDPTWDALRSEPRFNELLRKAGHSS